MGSPAIYNPTNQLYGTVLLQFGTASFIAEDTSVTRPTVVLSREDELGAPVAEVGIADWVSGDATVQVPPTGAFFSVGNAFTASFMATPEHFWVSEVGQTFAQRDLRKVRITFRKIQPPEQA